MIKLYTQFSYLANLIKIVKCVSKAVISVFVFCGGRINDKREEKRKRENTQRTRKNIKNKKVFAYLGYKKYMNESVM